MGMDVYGTNATSEAGRYFRANVWSWHPLWTYSCAIGELDKEIAGACHYNDGHGLDAEGAVRLADRLQAAVESGACAEHVSARQAELDALPSEPCPYCGGSGIRTDDVGLAMRQPEHALEPSRAAQVGRTHGWCNGCDGAGAVRPSTTYYTLSAEMIHEWIAFLRDCGGFEVW